MVCQWRFPVRLPLIDFSTFDPTKPETLESIGKNVEHALTTTGFMAVTNLDVSASQLKEIFALSRGFFAQSSEEKSRSAYRSAAENFGYQALGVEYLDPSQASDIKETFTMRNVPEHDKADDRWPSGQFRDSMNQFYLDCMSSAYKVQQVFSTILNVPRDFFVKYHNGENVSLRLLHYPPISEDNIAPGQLGAGAHTDYGMITLLFQDNIGGLQVYDDGVWFDADPVEGAIVVNTGDLMERWTNGRFKSTLHRVQARTGNVPRSSIAVFVDPDSATPVQVLDSCIDKDHPAQFDPITAGEHIQEKIKATHLSKN
jgi:isopenicillin N synthase-like dioxygenase